MIVWVTITAVSIGTPPGTAKASGRTTSELRVAALNDTTRMALGSRRRFRATNQPINGARMA